MELRNKEILLTINQKGVLGKLANNADSKSQIKRCKLDLPFRQKLYKYTVSTQCVKKTKLNSQSVNYFIQKDNPVRGINKKHWEKMSERQRLEAHLNLFDEGFGISWSVIEC